MTFGNTRATNIEVYGFKSAVGWGEERAFAEIASKLRDSALSSYWRIYFNLEILPSNTKGLPKNIDVIAISDAGVWVAELKSFSKNTILTKGNLLVDAVTSANSGARIICGIIKSVLGEKNGLGWITGDLVFEDLAGLARKELFAEGRLVNGVRLRNLDEFVNDLATSMPGRLTIAQVEALCGKLTPYAKAKMFDRPRWYRNYRNLEASGSKHNSFHRILRGQDALTSERI